MTTEFGIQVSDIRIDWPILYKLSSTGKIHEWAINAVKRQAPGICIYQVTHGQQDGKQQSTSVNVAYGKNLGRSNETTPWEQCQLEAESKWKKQQDKGYVESLKDMKAAKAYLPMLAKNFRDYSHKITYPCLYQPKKNGVRCLAYYEGGKVVLQTRKGKPFNSIPHIEAALLTIFQQNPDIVLDGELFSKQVDFQKIISIVKQQKKVSDEYGLIEYHIYDSFYANGQQIPMSDRYLFLTKLLKDAALPLVLVPTGTIHTPEEVAEKLAEQEQAGEEGIMLRNCAGFYEQDRRSDHLQKVKTFQDEDFEIVGAKPGIGKFEKCAVFECRLPDDRTFFAMPTGSKEEREEYLTNINKYIGKKLTVKFFEYTRDGVPQFPIGIKIKDDCE